MQQRQLPAGRKRALTPTPKWATPSPPHAKKTCRVANHGDAASDAGGPQSTQNDGGVSASTGCSSITAGIGSLSCDQRRRWQMMRRTEAAHLTIHNPTGGASSDQLGSSHTMLAHVLASEQQKPASRLWDEDALYYYPPHIPMDGSNCNTYRLPTTAMAEARISQTSSDRLAKDRVRQQESWVVLYWRRPNLQTWEQPHDLDPMWTKGKAHVE
jgi:hypothetical protein